MIAVMKKMLGVLLLLPVLLSQAQTITIEEIRQQYAAAIGSSQAADQFLTLFTNKVISDPLLLGYKGAAQALIAKHSWNPYTKLDYVKLANATFGDAVKAAPANGEIRFLRFSVQYYVPSFLGQSGNLQEDKAVIIQQLPELKKTMTAAEVKEICDFLLQTHLCTAAEETQLKSNLP